MPIHDTHVHTSNSPDADFPESELALKAVDKGLAGVGFVAHVDYNPKDYCYAWFKPGRYDRSFDEAVEAMEDGKGATLLCKGIEVGEPHRFSAEVVEATGDYEYDFVIGALHWVGDSLILEKEPFLALQDPLELVEEYYRESAEMVESSGFDAIAHVGIFRRGMKQAGLEVEELDETRLLPDLVRSLLEGLVARGIALELNTSGLRRKEEVTYPTLPVLRLYRELGGELVTLGSDSHRDPWLFYGLEEGTQLLRAAGFSRAVYFKCGEAVPYDLD
jgi:histidinol-phosphatase (PHP family)